MQIDYCLILAAGQGTRMGEVGKHLPKVLWPVFERSLLELQVLYAKSLGIQKVFINLHYKSEMILSYVESIHKMRKSFEGVEFLLESPEVLDIGGAIHHLAQRVQYQGSLLVLNSDQFFILGDHHWQMAQKQLDSSVLMTYKVSSKNGYNGLYLETNSRGERIVKKIIPHDQVTDDEIETYTGISLIQLDQLDKEKEVKPSSFFKSVCPLEKEQTKALLLEDVDYWDFGTLNRYAETMHRILKVYKHHSRHPFLRFLVDSGALKTWKINLLHQSYHALAPGVINLNKEMMKSFTGPSVLFGNWKIDELF